MTPVRGIILKHPFWRADREAEGARLLSEYGPQAHLGFESPALRQNFLLVASLQRAFFLPRRTFSKISLAFSTGKWHSIYLHAALPQLDRGPDYESGRHRFESYTPHHLNLGAPSGALFFIYLVLKLLHRKSLHTNTDKKCRLHQAHPLPQPCMFPP